MARLLGHSPSTVSREISRNGGYDRYRAARADEKAWVRARRPKRCKLAHNPRLRQAVARKLRSNWSPEQIAGWLKRAYPADEFDRVSHETIYRSLFVQARGVLKKELLGHLRSKRTICPSKRAGLNGDRRGQIKDIVSIRERPAAIEDRAVPGHWEGDLLSGSKNSYIATLVERHTRYVTLAKVTNKDTQTVVSALIKQAKRLPDELYKTLDLGPGQGACGSSAIYARAFSRFADRMDTQWGRFPIRVAVPMAARIADGKPDPQDLRECVIATVDAGTRVCDGAGASGQRIQRYKVVGRRRTTGETTARLGRAGRKPKLAPHDEAIRARVAAHPDARSRSCRTGLRTNARSRSASAACGTG